MSDPGEVTCRLTGRVTFDTLARTRAEGEARIAEAGERVIVDLSELQHGNSAAVAVLMAWWRLADHLDKSIVFANAPAGLRNIIELSGMTSVLPLAASAEVDGAGSAGLWSPAHE